MSGPTFSIPDPADGYTGTPASSLDDQRAKFFGEDIYYDLSVVDDTGKPDYVVTGAGDWALVTGLEALQQSLLRRLLTAPGEWATLPDFGVGASQYVKARNTPAARAELEHRIRSQFLRDDRVEAISGVTIEQLADDQGPGVKITVLVVAAGRLRTDQPLPVSLEIR